MKINDKWELSFGVASGQIGYKFKRNAYIDVERDNEICFTIEDDRGFDEVSYIPTEVIVAVLKESGYEVTKKEKADEPEPERKD